MLIIDNPQPDLFDGWLPENLWELSEELAFADKALSDSRVIAPFLKQAKLKGRPSTAISTYLRMMYLKERYQMSYGVLVTEVSDSLKWRRFCHLPLSGKVPDDKTLIKLTAKYGEKAVKTIHDTVVRQAAEAKIIRGRKMRLDTTVTESNIHFPTDSGLVSDGVRLITRTVKKIKEVVKLKVRFRSRMRAVKWRMIGMARFLKGNTDKAKKGIRKTREEILAIGQKVWAQAMQVLEELQSDSLALKEGASKVGLVTLPEELKRWAEIMKRILEQTSMVLGGNVHIPNRLISFFDTRARPIQKGKLNPKTEFGRKVLIQEAEKGLVSDYQVHVGNPPDQPMLEPGLDRHKELFGHDPTDVAGDRGFHLAGQDKDLHVRGIQNVSIPVKGKRSGRRERTEKSNWFKGLQAWRSGGEGKISLLKRKYGARRTKVRGDRSTEIALGWGIIAHNLVLLSRLSP